MKNSWTLIIINVFIGVLLFYFYNTYVLDNNYYLRNYSNEMDNEQISNLIKFKAKADFTFPIVTLIKISFVALLLYTAQ